MGYILTVFLVINFFQRVFFFFFFLFAGVMNIERVILIVDHEY
jgi:hypothetical protein